ncbi:toll/interleukin-1 receptor domain-containing protein [Lentzea sp. NPDC054927]
MYDGFISYSHAADRPLARSLQRSLHQIGRPWYKPRALRVFRDDVSLAASPDLWSSIQDALLASRTFTLMACPESAASPWVGREAALWREKKSRETFLIVLTGGELVWDDEAGDFDWDRTTALPRALAGWFEAEPLWVDLREPERRRGKEFRAAAATVAAAIHGVAKDELISEDLRQQRRLVAVLASLLSVALVAGGVAVWQQGVAAAQRDRATEQARIALSRALSGEAQRLMPTNPQLAIRLALASWGANESVQAKAALMSTLDRTRHVVSVVSPGTDTVSRSRGASSGVQANVAVSADGAVLAHAYSGGNISLWDTKSRRPTGVTLPERSYALALSGDGRRIASANSLTVKVWNTKDGSLTHDIPFAGAVNRVAMSPNGRWLAMSGGDSGGATPKFGVWNLETGLPVINVEGDDVPGEAVEFLGDRLYTVDGRSANAKVVAFEPASNTWSTFGAGRTTPHGLAISTSLAVINGSTLELWDVGTRTRTRTADVGKDACCVSISADGQRIAVGTGQGAVLLFDQTLTQTTQLFGHAGQIRDLRMSDDGKLVASIAENGSVVLTAPDQDARLRAKLQGPAGVNGVAVSTAGTAAISQPGGIVLRELSTLAEKSAFSAPNGAVRLSPDGQRLLVGAPGAHSTWDTTTGTQVGSIFTDEVGFLGDSRHLITARSNGTPLVEDAGKRGTNPVGGSSVHQQIATNARGDVIAIVTKAQQAGDGFGGTDITLWRWGGGELEKIRQIHFAALVLGFAVSEDGEQVAASDVDGRVLLDDSNRTGEPVVFGQGLDSPKASVAFAPGLIAQAHSDTGELMLWNSADGTEVGTWQQPGAAGPVAGLAATGGGLLTARKDGLLAFWEAEPAAWARTLCPMITGGLSAEEQRRYLGDIDVPWPCR